MWFNSSMDGPARRDVASTWLACLIIVVLALGLAESNVAVVGFYHAVHASHTHPVASHWLRSSGR